jgi:integrase/recombinase XerD
MKTFNDYLQEAGYTPKTIRTKEDEARHFTKWCKKRSTTPDQIDYKMCLKYIEHLTKKGNSKKTVNHKLAHLRNYFKYLIDEAYRIDNPIESTFIRGEKKHTNYTILELEELDDLYYSFETDKNKEPYYRCTAKRNKMIVGLLVYQGLDTKDFRTLKLEHLQLQKGKIYIPGRKRSNARILDLKPWQIMEMMEYVNTIRPVLEKRVKNLTDHERLFPYGEQFTIISILIKKMKTYNQKISSAKQIRASVIIHWLGQYNLRKVQYLAGHKHICSTENYLQDDLENLHEIVNNFHPIH